MSDEISIVAAALAPVTWEEVLHHFAARLQMKYAWIEVDASASPLAHVVMDGHADDEQMGWVMRAVHGLEDEINDHHEPFIIEDVTADSRFAASPVREMLPRSLVVLPLASGAARYGVLYAGGERPVSAEAIAAELRDWQLLLTHRLHHQRQQTLLMRERWLTSWMSELARAADEGAPLQRLLQMAARAVVQVTSVAGCWIGVRDEHGEYVTAFDGGDLSERQREWLHERIERTLFAGYDVAPPSDHDAAPMTIDGIVRYPIRANDDVIGHMALVFASPGRESEVRPYAESLCTAVAQAVTCSLGRRRIEQAYEETIQALIQAVDVRDPYSCGHCFRVSELAKGLASYLGADATTVREVGLAGLLHDIGNLSVPEEVLWKEGPLTEAEWALLRQAPVVGARIVANIQGLESLVPMIRHHFERYDGEGYPTGLRGREIPWGARLLAVVNTFDALVNARSYRAAVSIPRAYEILQELAGSHLDPEMVSAFLDWHPAAREQLTEGPARMERDRVVPASESSDHLRLTTRETEVLSLIAQGLSNREIGARLGVSEKTVKNHITNLFHKLGVRDRTQAVVVALQTGIQIESNVALPK